MVNEPGKLAGAQRAREKEKGAGQFAVPQREEEENYEKLLDQYGARKFAEGEVMKGMVLKITDTDVIVDIGYKSEGVIPVTQFIDPNGRLTIKVGDIIDVLLEDTEDIEGHIVLSKEKAEKVKVWEEVERAYNENRVLRGRVVERIKGGLSVDIGVRAFLPGSQIDVRPVKNLDAFRGKEIECRVIKLNRKRGNIVLSRKLVLENEQARKKAFTLEVLKEDAEVRGIVTNLTDYGAFVELEPGVEGLIHVSEMSWSKRVKHPSKLLQIGQDVEALILDVDLENRRISLGLKQTEPDPWSTLAERYAIGSVISGRVCNLTDFGAFIEVEEGIDGLVHVSDISSRRIKHPSEVLKKGERVEAVILNIDSDNHRLSLGIKQLQPDVWEQFFSNHVVGDLVRGRVVRHAPFGIFVELDEGLEGLCHVSELEEADRQNVEHRFRLGEEAEFKIIKMSPNERKIALSHKAVAEEVERREYNSYRDGADGSATLADLFHAKDNS